MKIGLFGINQGPLATNPALIIEVAQAAEALGYESLWGGEHMCLPSPRVAPSPLEPTDPVLDPLPALTWAGAVTSKILLGTGILLLPQRNPVALAKEIASVDVLTNGRFLLGVGVGYLEPEFRAVGVPLEHRGQRADEHLAAMQALWGMDAPAFHGRFVDFEGVDAWPRPIRREGPPVVVGGHTEPAFRRAVRAGDEWYGYWLSPERAGQCIDGLEAAKARHGLGRDSARTGGRLPITITPPAPVDAKAVAAYAALGVDRLALILRGDDRDGCLRWLEANAPGKVAG